jgi:transcriptional regulator with XRE-family HTH domain
MNELEAKLGALLHVERERRNISLADLSNELKVSESNLEAIESGDVSALPSPLYYGLFAKSFAAYLGIDYTKTVEAIREDLGQSLESAEGAAIDTDGKPAPAQGRTEPELASPKTPQGPRIVRMAAIIGSVIIIVFVGVLVVLKFTRNNVQPANETESGTDDLTQSVIVDSSIDTAPTDYNWSAEESTVPDSLRLTLTSKGQSWATVLTDGDTAIYQSLTPWRTYTAAAQFRLVVSIGVPGAVDVTLNGERAYLTDPQTNTISRLEINQANRNEFKIPRSQERPALPTPQPGGRQDSTRDTASTATTSAQPGETGNR